MTHGTVLNQLLEHVASSDTADGPNRELAQRTLDIKRKLHDGLSTTLAANMTFNPKLHRQIYEMDNLVLQDGRNDETHKLLPGQLVRSEGEPPVSDEHANQAYDNCGTVFDFYQQVFGYTFLDLDHTTSLISSIHFENGFQNAQWAGDFRQLIYGDGGRDLHHFTACLDIVAHEMTHAVIQHTCMLECDGEPGALNEHIADVFAMMATLWAEKKTTAESDWLIGEGCLRPGIKGVALRNMKFPGTAYDDPKFGKDTQAASWAEVERAGKIWWTTMKMHRIDSTCTFLGFADTTVKIARELFDGDVAKIVRNAWVDVGVTH